MRRILQSLIERRRPTLAWVAAGMVWMLWTFLPAAGLASEGRPAVLDYPLRSLAEVPRVTAAPVDRDKAAAEDEDSLQMGRPYRFAIAQEVSLSLQESGLWESPSPRYRVWRLRILAPGALSLNFGFTRFDLPSGSQLSIYPADLQGPGDPRGVRIFDEDSGNAFGQLWTPVVLTQEVVVELLVPADRKAGGESGPEIGLVLGSINTGYRFFGETPVTSTADKSGTCNVDVVCPEGDPWRQEIDAVGVYTVGGVWKCTGALVNNTSEDGTPYFLTAAHCGVSAENAPSLVVYWNYQSPTCGLQGGGSLLESQTEAAFRAASTTSDFCLVELAGVPDPGFNVTYAGWDRRDAAPLSAVCIHHPSTDEKSISFENDPLTVTSYLEQPTPGNGTHLRVTDWDLGTTEPGSSGSPLFDQNHRIVGQLHGGLAACGNDDSDWYGRFYLSWDGTEPARRLRDWLDPGGTAAETLDLYDPRSALEVTPAADLVFTGVEGGPFDPAAGHYELSNTGQWAVDYGVAVSQDWLVVDSAGGVLEPGAQATVSVHPGPQAVALAEGTYQATVTFTDQTSGAGDIARNVVLIVRLRSFGIAMIAPNPFVDFATVTYSLTRSLPVRARILDMRGMVVRDYGTLSGQAGLNEVAWNGCDDAGRRQPAGLYVLELEAEGRRIRATLTHLH